MDTDSDVIAPEGVNGLVYTLISMKMATLKELRDDYDVYEVIDLYEICMVSYYNKYISMKNAK